MSLDEFIEEQKESLEIFRRKWLEKHSVRPEEYPIKLEGGSWWEQYMIFETGGCDEV